MEPLNTYIINRRKELGMSQVDVSNLLGKHPTYISKIETGKFFPPIKILYQLAEHLKVSVSNLTCRVGYDIKPQDFGIETIHGIISEDEMELITKYRNLPDQVKVFIKNSIERF